ncbi:MAG: YceD family protein [Enterocloster sp.]
MLINLSEVFTLEGKERTWTVPLEMRSYEGADGKYPVASSEPVTVTVKNLGNRKLALTGGTKVTLTIPCARCLEPVEYTCEIDFDQELDMSSSDDDRVKDLDEQSYRLVIIWMQTGWYVMNSSLNLPMKVLKEDCKGFVIDGGANLNYGTCGCDTRSLDPRMAVIQDIFKQFKEV